MVKTVKRTLKMNPTSTNDQIPSWFNEGSINESFDAREMLARGEHPLALVLEKASGLPQSSIYELITPFPPMPLIEKVKALGFESFSKQISGNEFHSYFYKL
jgi:hypothetical protein